MSDIKPTNIGTKRKSSVLKFLLSLVAAIVMVFILKQPGFTDSQVYVIFLLFFAIGLWFTEAIPAFAVGLFIIAFLTYTLGNKNLNSAPEKVDIYVNTFSSSIIWLMLGGFFLAAAMTKTKLDESLFRFTIRLSGTSPRKLLLGLMLTTMVASMLMSNTATTAMVVASVTPFLNTLGKKSKIAKGLLIGVAIAASTGGMATIIGSPPNLIAAGALENAGIKMEFLDWMLYGLPVSLFLSAISYFILIKLYIKDNSPISVSFLESDSVENTHEMKVQRTIVIVIASVTILMWLSGSFHGLSVAAVSAIPIVFLTLTGILAGKDIQALPWDTLLLVAGGLSLGVALQHTGILTHYADKLANLDLSTIAFLIILAYLTMLLSNIMSHTATSTVLIPLGMAILTGFKTEVSLIIALSSSTALFLPVSTPPNAIIYSTGFLEQKDFRVGGIVLGLLGPLLIILWVKFLT